MLMRQHRHIHSSNSMNGKIRQFSSSTESESTGIRGWMERRKERKEQEQYEAQMERLSNMEEFKLTDFKRELDRSLKGLTANISFLQTKEMKAAKDVATCVESMTSILGDDAVADDLLGITRLQRLQIADKADRTVEEIGFVISQIQNMDIMQKTLRRRKLEGKPLPENAQKMQEAIKKDAMTVMTDSQRDMVRKKQQGMAKRMQRRK